MFSSSGSAIQTQTRIPARTRGISRCPTCCLSGEPARCLFISNNNSLSQKKLSILWWKYLWEWTYQCLAFHLVPSGAAFRGPAVHRGRRSQCVMNWTARGSVNPPAPWSFLPPHQERYFYSRWKHSRSKVYLSSNGPRHACTAPKHFTLLETHN